MAPKIKYNVKGVERGARKQPKPGLYRAKITQVEVGQSKAGNDQLVVHFQITTDGSGRKTEFKGSKMRTWIGLSEASQWKLGEFVDAVNGPESGDLTKLIKAAVGTTVQIKVDGDTYTPEGSTEAQYSAKVGTLTALPSDDDDDDDDEEEDEDEDEDDDLDEDDDDEEEESDSDDDDDEDESDEDEDEDDDEEHDEEEEEVDYSALSLDELRSTCKERGIKATVKKNGEQLKGAALKKALIAKLEKDDASEDDPFNG